VDKIAVSLKERDQNVGGKKFYLKFQLMGIINEPLNLDT
jgi:hypothetical protein